MCDDRLSTITVNASSALPDRHCRSGRTVKFGIGASLLLLPPAATWATTAPTEATRIEQRTIYLAAERAWGQSQRRRYRQLAAKLYDYPLYPYLRYRELNSRLSHAQPDELRKFFLRFPNFRHNERLRGRWLERLALQGRWREFLEFYTTPASTRLQCLQLRARLELKRTERVAEDAIPLFLSGRSQPPACDPAFGHLYASEAMTEELLWQRIRLAMGQGNLGLARYLGRRLSHEGRLRLRLWTGFHQQPESKTRYPLLPDRPENREILAHGLQRLARSNLDKALTRWRKLKERYAFTAEETLPLRRYLARMAVRRKHPEALALLDETPAEDQETFDLYLRTVLRARDWQRLERWTRGEPPASINPLQWRYWYGRALDKQGRKQRAWKVFETLAGERDYYGFLSADLLRREYAMNHRMLPGNLEREREVAALPAVQRAREWHALGLDKELRSEWHHVLGLLDTEQLKAAARLADRWNWHDRVIFTLGRAKAYDDLRMRFPILYEQELQRQAQERDLDLGWMLALVRSESAFMENVRSPQGALGLMQVMPATGRRVARQLAMRGFHPNQLLQAKTNLRIGSAYLRYLYEMFNGDTTLATAAYNAGENRVHSWLRKYRCSDPDIWIEIIPFDETRQYVKRVLFYASIYDWRLKRHVVPVGMRMAGMPMRGRGGPRCSIAFASGMALVQERMQ